jgi:uncharacterized protein (UPF0276 family)
MSCALGYALRDANRPLAGALDWTGVEIDFSRADDPLRTAPYLADLRFDYVSLHTLELSVAGAEPPEDRYLDALLAVAEENGAVAITDHLGFTRGAISGAAAGHVMAPPWTIASLDATCRNINHIQRRFGKRKFFLENLAHFFELEGTIAEAEFFRLVLDNTGCGMLVDLTNLYANQRNFGTDALEFLDCVTPSADRIQVHLAGGYFHEKIGRYVDSHSEPVHEEVWRLLDRLVALAGPRIEAVFIERDWNFPATASQWQSDLSRARRILSAGLIGASEAA